MPGPRGAVCGAPASTHWAMITGVLRWPADRVVVDRHGGARGLPGRRLVEDGPQLLLGLGVVAQGPAILMRRIGPDVRGADAARGDQFLAGLLQLGADDLVVLAPAQEPGRPPAHQAPSPSVPRRSSLPMPPAPPTRLPPNHLCPACHLCGYVTPPLMRPWKADSAFGRRIGPRRRAVPAMSRPAGPGPASRTSTGAPDPGWWMMDEGPRHDDVPQMPSADAPEGRSSCPQPE